MPKPYFRTKRQKAKYVRALDTDKSSKQTYTCPRSDRRLTQKKCIITPRYRIRIAYDHRNENTKHQQTRRRSRFQTSQRQNSRSTTPTASFRTRSCAGGSTVAQGVQVPEECSPPDRDCWIQSKRIFLTYTEKRL